MGWAINGDFWTSVPHMTMLSILPTLFPEWKFRSINQILDLEWQKWLRKNLGCENSCLEGNWVGDLKFNDGLFRLQFPNLSYLQGSLFMSRNDDVIKRWLSEYGPVVGISYYYHSENIRVTDLPHRRIQHSLKDLFSLTKPVSL